MGMFSKAFAASKEVASTVAHATAEKVGSVVDRLDQPQEESGKEEAQSTEHVSLKYNSYKGYKTIEDSRHNYLCAIVALSYYAARADGIIDEYELEELRKDLGFIPRLDWVSDETLAKIADIAKNKDLSFEDCKVYLDGLGISTLEKFQKDIDAVIKADGIVTSQEREVVQEYADYLASRKAQ